MDLSVVVPIFNEVENIPELHRELDAMLRLLGLEYEVIFVDDGSTDGSGGVLGAVRERDPRVVVVTLSRNYGQTAALAAGLARSTGEDVVTLDGDRQNPPSEIPRLLAKRREGFDLVAGWRADRQDTLWSRRLPSLVANWLIGRITGVRLHDYGCTLRVMRGDMARSLRLYGEMHRFIPALIDDLGGRITEVPVGHRPRVAGTSKYGLSRTVRVILDLVTVKFLSSYATRPIHIFGVLGLVATTAGVLIMGMLSFEKLFLGYQIGERPLLLLGVLLTMLGLQFITTGLLGELLVRTYHESQNKPVYRIAGVAGGGGEPGEGGSG